LEFTDFLPLSEHQSRSWLCVTSIAILALRSSLVNRGFSRWSSWHCSSSGAHLHLGPHLSGVKPLRMPVCRSRRQLTRCDVGAGIRRPHFCRFCRQQFPRHRRGRGRYSTAVSISFAFHTSLSVLLRGWNLFRFLRSRIAPDPSLPLLPAKLSPLPVPAPAARLQPAGVPAASPRRLPPAQD
jgi:hypothetical protein